MNAELERRAEVLRLAQALDTDPAELASLQRADAEDLRALRCAVSDALLERHRDAFQRAAGLAGRLPGPLAATLAQHAMGPVLAARAAALLEPAQATELARRLPASFLAEIAEHVDLRHVGALLDGIPVPTLREAATELRRRRQWVVLGTVVSHLELDVVAQLLDAFDGEALLRSSLMLEDPHRLDAFTALLDDDHLDAVVEAAHRHDLWAEAVWLVGELSPAQRLRVVGAIERLREEALDRLAALLLAEAELRAAAEPLIALAPDHLRARIGA